MRNARLDEAQDRIKTAWRNINNLRYADDTTFMAESEEELKRKEESDKAGLKLNFKKNEDHGIWSHYCMANRGGNKGKSERHYFLGFQNHCRWWVQPWKTLAPWKKSYDQNRQYIKKEKLFFVDKGPLSESYGFSSSHVWMWELHHKERRAPELMFLNCGVEEDSWESLGLQGDQTSPS